MISAGGTTHGVSRGHMVLFSAAFRTCIMMILFVTVMKK